MQMSHLLGNIEYKLLNLSERAWAFLKISTAIGDACDAQMTDIYANI